ncbi:MAG: substrate-binding domain-containing protein [Spirochaetales bacterium]|nr:substrate-binding domain-containing protein [Spirochaetales bacterium]
MANGTNGNSGRRMTVGFLVQESIGAGGFHELVWYSMVEAARKRGVNALIFAGGSLDSAPYNPFEKNLNLVYDLIHRDHLDGLIISSPIGNYVSEERFQQFCRQFAIPVVTVVGSRSGFPSVRVNNRNGLRDAILHLVEEHKARKIAFVKGAAGNVDAEERLTVYRETMNEAGLPIDPDLIYNGMFNEESGGEAVTCFVKEKGKSFDAVVASNDAMALGALTALRDLGIQIPWEVKVTGFDDTIEARASVPPITTVRQPIDEMCGAALDLLERLIRGEAANESIVIPTQLVVRQSCGCSSGLAREAGEPRRERREGGGAPAEILLGELRRSGIEGEERELAEVVAALCDDVRGREPPAALPKLRRIFQDNILRGRGMEAWQRALCVLRKWTRALWPEEAAAARAEDIVYQATVVAGEYSKQALASRAIVIERKLNDLTEVGQLLITTFNFDELKNLVKSQLTLLKIPSCFLSVFRDISNPTDESEVFVAYRDGGEDAEISHRTHTLPEKSYWPRDRRYTYAVHPLTFRERRLGYAMFELGPEDGLVYNTLEVQISSSLMGSELIREREKTETEEKKRSDTIQELVRPMLDSIETVTATAREKIGMIEDLIAVTKENGEKVDSTSAAIKAMNEKIEKMADVIGLIDDVSSRVNIMAINTSIESAHAGAYGKGFAVIAGEIRKLADSIKENATVIANYLKDIRPTIDGSRKAGDESREAFRRLENDVADVAHALRQITDSMDALTSGSGKILSIMNIS